MNKRYILEVFDDTIKEMFEKEGFEYVSSDLSCNPEGFLIGEKAREQLKQFDEMNTDNIFKLHKIPDEIVERYENTEDFVTDYWDGDIILGKPNFRPA